jgi:hypothetical protein
MNRETIIAKTQEQINKVEFALKDLNKLLEIETNPLEVKELENIIKSYNDFLVELKNDLEEYGLYDVCK